MTTADFTIRFVNGIDQYTWPNVTTNDTTILNAGIPYGSSSGYVSFSADVYQWQLAPGTPTKRRGVNDFATYPASGYMFFANTSVTVYMLNTMTNPVIIALAENDTQGARCSLPH